MPGDERPKSRPVSRRGLLGMFTKGFAEARDVAKTELARREAAAGKAGDPRPSARTRPASEAVAGRIDAAGRVDVDLSAAPLAVGGSLRIDVAGLPVPLVLVRVTDRHHTACTGACPEDASDLLWSGPQDVLWCPSCGSRWRLDGSVVRGPASDALASWHAVVLDGVARLSR